MQTIILKDGRRAQASFAHLRILGAKFNAEANRWIVEPRPHGGITLCTITVEGGVGSMLLVGGPTYGIAYCSPLDTFDRAVGRAIALGRAVACAEGRQVRWAWNGSVPFPDGDGSGVSWFNETFTLIMRDAKSREWREVILGTDGVEFK